jgi:hypothetical protein
MLQEKRMVSTSCKRFQFGFYTLGVSTWDLAFERANHVATLVQALQSIQDGIQTETQKVKQQQQWIVALGQNSTTADPSTATTTTES